MRVHGVGPVPCDLCFVGEAPGWQEDRVGRPFVGKTGTELDRYLTGDSLPTRAGVFLTNLYRQYMSKDYVYTAEDLAADEPELLTELARVRPRTIVTLGRHSTRYFLGDVDMDAVERIPWLGAGRWEGITVYPIIHPAAGMHNPEMSPYVVAGFEALATFYQTGVPAPRRLYDDPYPEPNYAEVQTQSDLQRLRSNLREVTLLGVDTEGSPAHPWSVQCSTRPGGGVAIVHTPQGLRPGRCLGLELGLHLARTRPRLVYHSALHDLGMMRALGLPDDLPFDDTMVMAYLLQLEPQDLKAGCLRHCNMRMQSYEDIMRDVDHRLTREWLRWVWEALSTFHREDQERAFEVEKAKGRRIRALPKLPKSPFYRAVERCLTSKRPRALWGDQDDAVQAAGVRLLGPIPEPSLDRVDRQEAIRYGCRDADGTLRLREQLWPKIQSLGLEDVYHLEVATYPLIDRMQRIGLKPDLPQFARLSGALEMEIRRLKRTLEEVTGWESFNANSGDHVAELLFDRMGLEPLKMTRSGDRGSTNDKILEALERSTALPVITDIRRYREFYKLKYTFVDQMPSYVNRWPYDGRIHTTFRTTRVVTGRLAATKPNVLAQPEHGSFADEFKRGWVAEEGHVLCSWDESQVELRVLAHLSQDPVMLGVYRGERRNPDGTPIDLHAALAERIFGVPPHRQSKSEHRLPAKAINFGIPMGMTKHGLMIELRKNGVDADEDTAQRWLDETLDLYRGVRVYMDQRIREAERDGRVRCLSGRLRYIGGIGSRDERIREEAERFAFSTPIQEGATWIMKQAEVRIWEAIKAHWAAGRWVEPILQVHDRLDLECQEGLERELHRQMTTLMTIPPQGFSVPLAVEGAYGTNMRDMEAL